MNLNYPASVLYGSLVNREADPGKRTPLSITKEEGENLRNVANHCREVSEKLQSLGFPDSLIHPIRHLQIVLEVCSEGIET